MKFAFVAPRYGAEITSGAERACRLLAERVATRHDVDVLTTCARDPRTWRNEHVEGADRIRGVVVRRFAVTLSHDAAAFARISAQLREGPRSRAGELEWLRQRGPWAPGLIEHLRQQHKTYDAILFFSLSHPTTAEGLSVAPERSIVVPYLLVDPVLRFGIWSDLLGSARGVGLMSPVEQRLLHGFIGASSGTDTFVGIGIDPAHPQSYPRHQEDPADALGASEDGGAVEAPVEPWYVSGRGVPFRRRHRLYGTFALYGGRVEPDNGCEEMLEYFDSYAETDPALPLVLMGVKMMKIPGDRSVQLAGVLGDRDRMNAFEAADVTIAPDADDLLAESVLESFAVGTPVLASARSESAVDLCRRAGGGLYYGNREEFREALRSLVVNPRLREQLGESGRDYVRQQHSWDAVLGRFDRLIARVKSRSLTPA